MRSATRKNRTKTPDSDGQARQLDVVYRSLSELKPDPTNPRIHPQHQLRQIAKSICAFGFCVPILLHQNTVVGGHGRLLAAQMLGLQTVPTIRLDHLSETQARAFRLADNKLSENATWDSRLLAEQLKALAETELSFDLEVTGFAMGEVDLLIEGLAPAPDGGDDPADALPDPFAGPHLSQPGDCWLLGRHRLLWGNALDQTAYTLLMNEQRAAMTFTDPPYNLKIEGYVSGLGYIKHKDFLMASGEMSEVEYTDFLTQACRLMAQAMHNGALAYIFTDWRHIGELLAAGHAVFDELKNVCVWDKSVGGMGSFYRSQHELVFVFKHGAASHRNNVQLGQYGRNRTNVWSYAGAHSFGRSSDEGNLLASHPTPKPVALVADAILDASSRHTIILDPFVGSGTTIIAAEKTGRICYAMDLDPRYVDTTIRRWQRWTGERARHASTGTLFDDLAQETGGHAHGR